MTELKTKRIMIIDDSEFSRTLIRAKLKRSGYSALCVPESSIEAWDMIANSVLSDEPYDLIITDLNMPGLDGMELISKIKEDPLSESLKIIVISADADQKVIEIVRSLGASAYIVKPFITSEMLAVVEAVLLDKEVPEIKGAFG